MPDEPSGWRATQATDHGRGRQRKVAGLVTAHLADPQLISKVEPSLNSPGPPCISPSPTSVSNCDQRREPCGTDTRNDRGV
jgi:hypothetical protein